jgi:tetratricopeptide (TPR) repeat protein
VVTQDEVRHLQQVLKASPGAFHAMHRLIAIHLERRQWDEALVLTRRYVELYPDDAGLVEFVAGYLGVAGRYADQIELIEQLVARRQDYKSLSMLGFALDRSGDHHRAIEVLNRAVKLRPDVFLALHYLGEAYQALERREDAIVAYEAELRVRPQSLEVQRRIRALRIAGAGR